MKKLKRENKGFSLVELIVVVLILGILAVAVTPQIMNWVDKSKTNTDETTKESIEVAAQAAVLEFMEGKAVQAEVYKVTSSGVADDGADSNVTAGGTKLGAMIADAIGDVSSPKSSTYTYFEVAVEAATGQVTVTLK